MSSAVHSRAAWPFAALPGLAATLLLAGCGGAPAANGSSAPSAARSTTTVVGTQASATAADAIGQAIRTMTAIRSYQFSATETIAAARPLRVTVAGIVVSGQGVAYRFTVGGRQTQVVRLPGVTYVRTVPGKWKQIRRPRNLLDPSATLLGVLRAMRPNAVSTAVPNRRDVQGELSATSATALGLPAGGAAVPVAVTIDTAGHVLSLTVYPSASGGGRQTTVLVQTSYSEFDGIKSITRPA